MESKGTSKMSVLVATIPRQTNKCEILVDSNHAKNFMELLATGHFKYK